MRHSLPLHRPAPRHRGTRNCDSRPEISGRTAKNPPYPPAESPTTTAPAHHRDPDESDHRQHNRRSGSAKKQVDQPVVLVPVMWRRRVPVPVRRDIAKRPHHFRRRPLQSSQHGTDGAHGQRHTGKDVQGSMRARSDRDQGPLPLPSLTRRTIRHNGHPRPLRNACPEQSYSFLASQVTTCAIDGLRWPGELGAGRTPRKSSYRASLSGAAAVASDRRGTECSGRASACGQCRYGSAGRVGDSSHVRKRSSRFLWDIFSARASNCSVVPLP